MSRTVSDAFTVLLQRIEPTESEDGLRRSHARTIKQALEAEFDSVSKVEVIGSHKRETAIHLHSDVDYLAVISRADLTYGGQVVSSKTALERVRKAVEGRLSQYRTTARVDGPSVVVHFGGGAGAVDVVPAYWYGTTANTGHPCYMIPDGQGAWMATSPTYYDKYLRDAHDRSGSRLAPTVRLLKAWKYARTPAVPLLGFHVEMLLASENACGPFSPYGNMLSRAFGLLRNRQGSALNDPLGISARIPATRTPAQSDALFTSSAHAADHADAAINAERLGDTAEAFRQWDIVFNGTFPARW